MNRQQRRGQAGQASPKPKTPVQMGAAPQTLFDAAINHHESGRLADAERLYAQILQAHPQHADAMHLLGVIACQTGRPGLAVEKISHAIRINGSTAFYYSNLSNALRQLGRLDDAVEACRKAAELQPDFAQAHANLGAALYEAKRFDEAVCAYTTAIHLNPDDAFAHTNLGNALKELGRLDEALSACNTAIRLKPDYAEAHRNLGALLEIGFGRMEDARTAYETAIRLKPDDVGFNFNHSCFLLKIGAFPEGWAQYEWRWQLPTMIAGRRDYAQPQWRGEAEAGKTLLLHAEQGFGDTLQFCRFAPLAAERGMRVVLEAPKPLIRLLRSLPAVAQVIGQGDALPPFDFHAPLMSLPRAFGTIVATIPAKTPYLSANENAIAAWRQRLSVLAHQSARIGVVWAGNPKTQWADLAAEDRRRSIAPELLAPLFAIQGLDFFSLQKDGPAAPPEFPLFDFMGEMGDFADTAALIANLDLVISVDTAVAHLAAAIGKPVWLLNRFDSCWRWLTGRRDSPWYPKLRLYNQPQPGDWKTVIAEITADLKSQWPDAVRRGRDE